VEGGEATVESTMEIKTENITILDDWDKYNEMIELFYAMLINDWFK
jgi:hypothetical protein